MNLLTLNEIEAREAVQALEDSMLANKNCSTAKDMEEYVTKYFAPGVYVREMRIPKNVLVVGKIHRDKEVCILSKGIMLLTSDSSAESIIVEAPYTFVAGPGKKVGLAIEDSIFINIHPNPDNLTDIDELEKQIIATSYTALEKTL